MLFNPPLLLVTNRQQAIRPLTEIISDYWQAGGRWVWLREKDLPRAEIIHLLHAVIPGAARTRLSRDLEVEPDHITKQGQNSNASGSRDKPGMTRSIILSNHADLVAEYNLAGVHLPQSADILKIAHAARAQLKPGQLLGISIHNETELKIAVAAGADYVIAAPIFPTASKPGYGPSLGLAGLTQLVTQSALPIIALGGITPEIAPQCLTTGAAAIAVMGEFMRQANTKMTVQSYLKNFNFSVIPAFAGMT